jgi:hypothetical protein
MATTALTRAASATRVPRTCPPPVARATRAAGPTYAGSSRCAPYSALLCVLALGACVDTTRPPRTDAGPARQADTDASAAPDAGTTAADASADTSAPDDAQPTLDAAAPLDAGLAPDVGAVPDAASPEPTGPRLHPVGALHSPLVEADLDHLRTVMAQGGAERDDVLAKVGDSITVSTSFLHCFAGARVDLGGREHLRGTLEHFLAGQVPGGDPYTRTSLAAGVGWSASRALSGTPSPLSAELDATHPRFATLMYGTNDVGYVDVDTFLRNMATIVDTLLARGTVPVLSSIPPRDDDSTVDARVPVYGGLLRALALSRGVPFVDYHLALLSLPAHGLGTDGIHPRAASTGACDLTARGLSAAANVRNLLVLEALDRVRRGALEGEPAPDTEAPRLGGEGTRAAPYVLPSLPASISAHTGRDGVAEVSRWTGCSNADESGPELRFRFALTATTRVRATVASARGADLDVHLVRAGGTGADCVARGDREATATLEPGDWDVVVDSYAGGGSALPGELYLDVR